MADQIILEKTEGSVRTLTLNRPERLNAISVPLAKQILEALERTSGDKNVRLLVLRGTGRGFSAGGDIKIIKENMEKAGKIYDEISRYLHEAIKTIAEMPQPVLAVVKGPAYGAGFGLALSCDIVTATPEATFCPSFINLALSPNALTTHLLPRILGPRLAAEALMTAREFSAEEAHHYGLVNHVWTGLHFEERFQELIQNLLQKSPLVLGRIKKLLHSSLSQEMKPQLKLERHEIANSAKEKDFERGLNNFFARKRNKQEI